MDSIVVYSTLEVCVSCCWTSGRFTSVGGIGPGGNVGLGNWFTGQDSLESVHFFGFATNGVNA